MVEHNRNRITRPLAYQPRWEGPFEAHARRFAAENHWRVRFLWPDYEDVVGECRVIFCRCLHRYRNKVNNGAWFMGLFKRALINDFNTFARRSALQMQGMKEFAEQQRAQTEQHEHNYGPLAARIDQASPELQKVLGVLSTASPQLLDVLLPDHPQTMSHQSLARRWCRLAKTKNLREDLILELHDLLD